LAFQIISQVKNLSGVQFCGMMYIEDICGEFWSRLSHSEPIGNFVQYIECCYLIQKSIVALSCCNTLKIKINKNNFVICLVWMWNAIC